MKRNTFLILTLATLTGLYGCSEKETASKTEDRGKNVSRGKLPDVAEELYSFKVEGFNKDNRIQWNLEGESADVIFDKVNIRSLKAVYYGDDATLTIFADKGVYDKKTHDIELKDNIIGKTSDGGELVTDYAKWNAKTEEITTDSHVVIKRQNIICKGRGLITKPRLRWAAFEKEIEVDIAPDKQIICDGPFELNQEKHVAIFNNNVKIIDPESETFTDRLTVYLNPETNEIERIVTEGNVKVVHKGDVEDVGKLSF